MTVNGTKLAMTRGDSESIKVTCSELFHPGDEITLTVRQSPEDPVALQKTVTEFPDGEAVIGIDPEDTAGLDFGDYVYDVQWTRGDGTVHSLYPVAGWFYSSRLSLPGTHSPHLIAEH